MNPEQLLQALREADRRAQAGDQQAAQDAQRIAQLLQQAIDAQNGGQSAAPEPAPMDMESGSIADSLGKGLTFGFADEIAGGLGASVNSIAGLFGGGTGESFGEAYRGIRDAARYNEEAFRTRNPKTSLAAEIGGGLLTGGAGAARAGAVRGTQSLGRLAGLGAVEGGIYGAGASDADLTQGDVGGLLTDTAVGAGLGGVTGGALPVIGRAAGSAIRGTVRGANRLLGGGLNEVGEQAVRVLDDAGVPMTAGQRGGSKALQQTETTLGSVPLVGGALEDTLNTQRQAYQQNILRMAGFADDDVAEGLVTPEALQRARERFTDRYTDALSGTSIQVGDEFVDTLVQVQNRFSNMLAGGRSRKIENIVNDLFDRATDGNLTGQAYQRLRSELGELARSSGKPRLQRIYTDLKRALDDEFLNAADTATGRAKQALDQEFAQFKQLEGLARRLAGGADDMASGNIPVSQLANLAAKSPGSQQWREFTQAAKAILPDKTPNSGTASRAITGGLLAGGSALNPGVIPAAVGANLTGRALANPQAVQRGAQALGRGVDVAGLLATPAFMGTELPGTLQNQMRGLL